MGYPEATDWCRQGITCHATPGSSDHREFQRSHAISGRGAKIHSVQSVSQHTVSSRCCKGEKSVVQHGIQRGWGAIFYGSPQVSMGHVILQPQHLHNRCRSPTPSALRRPLKVLVQQSMISRSVCTAATDSGCAHSATQSECCAFLSKISASGHFPVPCGIFKHAQAPRTTKRYPEGSSALHGHTLATRQFFLFMDWRQRSASRRFAT